MSSYHTETSEAKSHDTHRIALIFIGIIGVKARSGLGMRKSSVSLLIRNSCTCRLITMYSSLMPDQEILYPFRILSSVSDHRLGHFILCNTFNYYIDAQSFGFVTASSKSFSRDPSNVPISGMYSHRAARGKLIRMLSILAPGVLSPKLVPRS